MVHQVILKKWIDLPTRDVYLQNSKQFHDQKEVWKTVHK